MNDTHNNPVPIEKVHELTIVELVEWLSSYLGNAQYVLEVLENKMDRLIVEYGLTNFARYLENMRNEETKSDSWVEVIKRISEGEEV